MLESPGFVTRQGPQLTRSSSRDGTLFSVVYFSNPPPNKGKRALLGDLVDGLPLDLALKQPAKGHRASRQDTPLLEAIQPLPPRLQML